MRCAAAAARQGAVLVPPTRHPALTAFPPNIAHCSAERRPGCCWRVCVRSFAGVGYAVLECQKYDMIMCRASRSGRGRRGRVMMIAGRGITSDNLPSQNTSSLHSFYFTRLRYTPNPGLPAKVPPQSTVVCRCSNSVSIFLCSVGYS